MVLLDCLDDHIHRFYITFDKLKTVITVVHQQI